MARKLETVTLSGQTVTSCHKDGVKVVPGDDQSCCQKLGSSHHAPSCLRVTYNSNKKRKKWTVSLFRTGRRWSVLAGIPQYLQQQQKEKEMDSLPFRTGRRESVLADIPQYLQQQKERNGQSPFQDRKERVSSC